MEREKFYRYSGNDEQVYGVRRLLIDEGTAKGNAIYEVHTAGGLELDILPDSGLDIGHLRFRGVNINYMTKNGYDNPNRFLPIPGNFDHTFSGGMLYTCGLLSAGPGNTDTEGDGEFHPLHGRFHGQSARNLFGYVDGDNICVGGEVKETKQGGQNFSVRRKFTIPAFGSEVLLEDEITNLTPSPVEYMMLYHCNFGWPMLSEKAILEFPENRKVTPRTKYAADNINAQCEITAPIDGEEEQVFFNEMHSQSEAFVRLKNPELGIKAELTWSLDTLPILAQWKNMRSGDYVLGLEPSSCYIMGRSQERKEGRLQVIKPFKTVKNFVRLKFSDLG